MRHARAKRFFHGGHDEGLVWRYCRTWTPEDSLRDSGPLVAPREQAISAVATASRTGPARSGARHDAFGARGRYASRRACAPRPVRRHKLSSYHAKGFHAMIGAL